MLTVPWVWLIWSLIIHGIYGSVLAGASASIWIWILVLFMSVVGVVAVIRSEVISTLAVGIVNVVGGVVAAGVGGMILVGSGALAVVLAASTLQESFSKFHTFLILMASVGSGLGLGRLLVHWMYS